MRYWDMTFNRRVSAMRCDATIAPKAVALRRVKAAQTASKMSRPLTDPERIFAKELGQCDCCLRRPVRD
jgi:hypothetical protein